MSRKAKVPTDVYFYIRILPDQDNYEYYHNTLSTYCKDKKLLRICGCFVDYCNKNTPINERIQLQNLLSIVPKDKFLICCFDKQNINDNTEEVIKFENQIKNLKGSVYFHLNTITEKHNRFLETHVL
jgi:hypothetical protein